MIIVIRSPNGTDENNLLLLPFRNQVSPSDNEYSKKEDKKAMFLISKILIELMKRN